MALPSIESVLPKHYDLFYGGEWHKPLAADSKSAYRPTLNPGTGEEFGNVAQASAADVDAAVKAARKAFPAWSGKTPAERSKILRQVSEIVRSQSKELALVDAFNTGNPVAEMMNDAEFAASNLDYFAGLIPMIKGETVPLKDGHFNYTIREPLGVVARITAYNHPLLFAAGRMGAPLAAGNTLILKPSDQAPLSALRLAEMVGSLLPPGVLNVLPGSVECGQALTDHPDIQAITLIGSVPTGVKIQQGAAKRLKTTILELGGKNALLGFPDANIDKLTAAVAKGMNFTWAGQSCGSTSRVFLHESIHDKVIAEAAKRVAHDYVPGVPTDMKTTMGPVVNKVAYDRVLSYIASAKEQGAKAALGGKAASNLPAEAKNGFFIEPTIFTGVTKDMRIANEEIFGPVMSVFKWNDEEELLRVVNSVEYGLSASIFSQNMATIQRVSRQVQSGYIWVNQAGAHYLNMPFGGYKMSGYGREECLEELLTFTQLKSIMIDLS